MDLQLVTKGFSLSGRRRKWIIVLAVCGVSGYGVYRVYNSPSVARKRKRLMKIFGAMVSMVELVSDSAEMIGVVSRDLKGFLQSDSDEVPNSLMQISKIVRSEEFSQSLVSVSEALTQGILRGYGSNSGNSMEAGNGSSSSSFTDRVMERVFSQAGTGFVSVVVGSFARNLVLAFYSDDANGGSSVHKSGTGSWDASRWVNVLCGDKCRELIADSIQKFVSTAVAVYLDKTMDINPYEDIFAGLTNPNHRDDLRDVLVTVCNGAVETLVKTSHQVLTSSSSDLGVNSSSGYKVIDQDETVSDVKHNYSRKDVVSHQFINGKSNGRLENSSWFSAISSTMAVPSNRKFLFDVTGRVTFETLRSIIEFLLRKLSEGFKQSFHIVHDEIVDKGRRVIRYIGAKSSILATIFISLYLHLLSSNRVLLAA